MFNVGVLEIYLFLFIIPFILGILVRLFLGKFKRIYILTLCLIILNIVSYIIVSNINTHGSEGPMLRCVQFSSFTVSMIIIEIIEYIKRLYKRGEKE